VNVLISESAFKDLEGVEEYYEKEGVSNIEERGHVYFTMTMLNVIQWGQTEAPLV